MSWFDDLMKEARERGDFDNLPGAGKKLIIDNDPHTPSEMRMAYKILKDNDLAPDWITQGKALERTQEKIITAVQKARRVYQEALITAQRAAQPALAADQARAKYERTLAGIGEDIRRFNSEVLTFNLKLPSGIKHRRQLNLQTLLTELLA